MRITTPSGTDLEFELNPENVLSCDSGEAKTPGIHMLGGQIGFIPKLSSISGRLVFEGAILPVPGVISDTVIMTVVNGVVIEIEGGIAATIFRNWLESFNDPSMFRLAHGCYGLNPGAKVTGKVLEDERVWGSTEWGLGYLSVYDAPKEHFDAPSHCDGLCLNSSIWLDGNQIMDTGKFVEPHLRKMAQGLGKE